MAKQTDVNKEQPLKKTGAKEQLKHEPKPKYIGHDAARTHNQDAGTEHYFDKVKDKGYGSDEEDIAQGFTRLPV